MSTRLVEATVRSVRGWRLSYHFPRATFKPQESEIYLCNLVSCKTIPFARKQTGNVISWCDRA